MATRRLRPEDWAPVPQTRIQIRAQHSPREPRDERVRIAKCAQKPPRPSPINYPPGELPPIPAGRESLDTDSPRAPEIVDFAAPSAGTWPRRGLPAQIVYQQQQWGPRRMGSPGSVSQYSSSRQSEMSFGILDYYTRDPSPERSETLPPTPKVPQGVLNERGCPKIGTPVIDSAMEKFDFGLGFEAERERSSRVDGSRKKEDAFESATTAPDARAGASQAQQQHEAQDVICTPPPPPPPKTDSTAAAKPTYSLFPKDTTPPSRPSITLASHKDSTSTNPTDAPIPSHTQPDPSYRPRKESLTSSLRSRKDSFTSYHRAGSAQQRIPLRVFSASSNSTSSVYTTPRTSNAVPAGANTRTSSSTAATSSPPDSAGTGKSQSRWSEDTITSPSPTALAFSAHPDQTPPSHGRRASFGSLLRGVESDGRLSISGGQYPACFFEDDDDEVVPLRRKLHFGRGGQGSGEWEGERQGRGRGKGGGWRRWVLCGCAG